MKDKTNEKEYEGERQQKQSLQWVFGRERVIYCSCPWPLPGQIPASKEIAVLCEKDAHQHGEGIRATEIRILQVQDFTIYLRQVIGHQKHYNGDIQNIL